MALIKNYKNFTCKPQLVYNVYSFLGTTSLTLRHHLTIPKPSHNFVKNHQKYCKTLFKVLSR